MTDTAPEPAATEVVERPDTGTTAPVAEASDDHSREAAKYRTALRATETERDALVVQVDGLRAAEVARIAAAGMADGTELLELGGVALADLVDEAGVVDPEKVNAAVAALLDARPHLRRRTGPRPDMSQGARPGTPEPAPVTWSDLLRQR